MVAVLAAACGKNGDGGGARTAGPPVAAPAAAAAVRYSASGDADVTKEQYRLWGVSADGDTAYVLRERRLDEPPRWALDTIDLRAGKRSATWEATGQREYVQLLPVDGTVEQAAVRFAALAAETGPWSTRTATHWVEAQAVSGGGMVYRTPEMVVADATGAEQRNLGEAGDVRVSPDGKRLLWIEDVEPFASGRVVVAEVAGDAEPQRGEERGWLREPMWSADGSAIYAVEAKDGDDPRPCVIRFAAADLSATSLACLEGTQPSIAQDPSGATLTFAVKTGGASTVRWMDAATGRERATRTGLPALAPQLEDVLLGDRGWLVSISPDWVTLIAVDLGSGKVATLRADGGFWEGVRATRWLGDRIVVLRRRGTVVELVTVDVSAMLR